MDSLVEQIIQGNHRAIARQITGLENGRPEALARLADLYPHTGRAYLVGITGPPGAGKSSLVNQLALAYRRQNRTAAVLSIDPTSPFTGGALLGDRVRLADLAGDPGLFVRSMASRGSLGGLARAAASAVRVFDAAGFEMVLIETVGAGQAEVDIAGLAHTVLVVEAPGWGDDVQAGKAGLLEIAHILVVNKADLAGADRAAATLSAMLEMGENRAGAPLHHGPLLARAGLPPPAGETGPGWRPPVLKTVAPTGTGVEPVVEAIARHRAYREAAGLAARRPYYDLAFEIQQLLQDRLLEKLLARLSPGRINQILERAAARRLDPYAAVDLLLTEQSPVEDLPVER